MDSLSSNASGSSLDDSTTSILPDNVGDDCPVFDGLFEYCSISAGGSMGELRGALDDQVHLASLAHGVHNHSAVDRGRCSVVTG